MSSPDVKILKLYEQAVIVPSDEYGVGTEEFEFRVLTGSRLLLTTNVKDIDLGAKVEVDVFNSFTIDGPGSWDNILNFTVEQTGYVKRVLTDFNKMFRVRVRITGGTVGMAMAIAVFDNAMTTRIENAEVDVHLTHKETSFRKHDSIRLGDGEFQAKFNADGSLNVNIVDAPSTIPERVHNQFNETPAVPNGVETLVVGYSIPSAKSGKLQRVEFSGENIASFTVYLNGVKIAKKQTYFSGPLNGEFNFTGFTEEGPLLSQGDLVELKVIHNRPSPGSFAGRIQLVELG